MENNSTPLKLHEVLAALLKPNGPYTQEEIEAEHGIPQARLSRYKNASESSAYAKHWRDFLTLLDLCHEHRISVLKHGMCTQLYKLQNQEGRMTPEQLHARATELVTDELRKRGIEADDKKLTSEHRAKPTRRNRKGGHG